MLSLSRRGVSPVIAIVLLLMMTVAAAGAAYFWLTSMQSSMQESSRKSIENIMEASGRRVTAQATLCKPTYPYEGLKGYWMMDEGSGNKTYDKSGNGNTGTLYPGPNTEIDTDTEMWTDGKVGGALKFDGNDSYVEVPHSSSINLHNHATISFWIYTHAASSNKGIYGKGNDPQGYGSQLSAAEEVSINAGGKWTICNRVSIPIEKWTHIVFVFDRPDVWVYKNGNQVASGSVDASWDSTAGMDFGRRSVEHDKYFNGTIDEVRIYDRALSENEIKELYDAENHSARRRIDVTVRNIGSEEIPKATWVANLKQDGTNVETDAYNASSIGTGELKTLKFYFKDFKPNTEYTIQLQGTGTSTTVSC